jgi:GNAT superfamily N-acetyltransferase
MPNTVIIRQLGGNDDLAEAVHLLQRFFREEGFDTLDEVIAENTRRMAALDVCGLFVAEQDARTIGVATVSMEFGIEFGWSAEMGDLYVVPEWRGKGLSRMIVEAVEAFLISRGARGYQVTVTPYAAQHHDLAKFYDRLGFNAEGRMILWRDLSSGVAKPT